MSKAAEVFPLCQHLDSLVDELRRRIPKALEEFDEDAIHQARVTTRRLKAAIELLQSTLDKEHSTPFARLGRKLRRRLGPLRDLDVLLGHLDEIKPTGPHASAVDWLRSRLVHDRLSAREKSSRKTAAADVLSRLGTWWAVRQDVIAADPKIPALLTQSLHAQLDSFIAHANALREQRTPSVVSDPTDRMRDPHELRIAGKNLRYTLELAKAQGFELPKAVLANFKKMQKFLGEWHDFVVMAERAMRASLDEEVALHDPGMQRQVLKLTDFALVRAQKQLDGFARLWADEGPALTERIRGAFPLTDVVSESQTGPGPAGSTEPPAPEAGLSGSAPAA